MNAKLQFSMRTVRLWLILFLAACLQAAEIRGRVLDPSGSATPNAEVLLLSSNQTVVSSTKSTEDGSFSFSLPARGSFSILVSKPGFVAQSFPVTVDEPEEIFRLAIAPVPNSVVVTAEAGLAEAAGESIQSVNAISRGQIEQRAPTVLADAFREEEGVDVQRTVPWMACVAVRGLLGKNVAIYRVKVDPWTQAQEETRLGYRVADIINVGSAFLGLAGDPGDAPEFFFTVSHWDHVRQEENARRKAVNAK